MIMRKREIEADKLKMEKLRRNKEMEGTGDTYKTLRTDSSFLVTDIFNEK